MAFRFRILGRLCQATAIHRGTLQRAQIRGYTSAGHVRGLHRHKIRKVHTPSSLRGNWSEEVDFRGGSFHSASLSSLGSLLLLKVFTVNRAAINLGFDLTKVPNLKLQFS